jgi:elongation factor Tu
MPDDDRMREMEGRVREAQQQAAEDRQRQAALPLLLPVAQWTNVIGQRSVASGRIERGGIRIGDRVEIVGFQPTIARDVIAIEGIDDSHEYPTGHPERIDSAIAGDQVDVFVAAIVPESTPFAGQVLAAPGSIRASLQFTADISLLTKEFGGRHGPIFAGYRAQFFFRTAGVDGTLSLPADLEMLMPGEQARVTVRLTATVAMEAGTQFAIRESNRTVGSGTVTTVA